MRFDSRCSHHSAVCSELFLAVRFEELDEARLTPNLKFHGPLLAATLVSWLPREFYYVE